MTRILLGVATVLLVVAAGVAACAEGDSPIFGADHAAHDARDKNRDRGKSPAPAELDRYNLVWTTPSRNAAGSMPIGNGEVGLNVWVEENGDLLFYIARTDSWSECNRLLKLGRVRVSLSPNPFAQGLPFRQELRLHDGQIVITAGDARLRVFVDAHAPVIHVLGQFATPRTVTARLENWRTQKHVLKGGELESSWTMLEAPASIEVWESPDVVSIAGSNCVAWRHRNAYSVVPLTLKHQGLESLAGLVQDPLLNRTFGGEMFGKGLIAAGVGGLKSARPVTRFDLSIIACAAQTDSLAGWQREVAEVRGKADSSDAAARRTAAWWHEFWKRSWIFVAGGPAAIASGDAPRVKGTVPISVAGTARSTVGHKNGTVPFCAPKASDGPSRISQAYILQRWITACAGRGHYPIKFNGSIFTVDPKLAGGPDFNADWRRWGDAYWWQNTRLPYFPMIARGDWDEVRTLFGFYRAVLPLCQARAKLYYQAEGAYFPETMTNFGTYGNRDYGWDRGGHAVGEVSCRYWRYAWQQGLELVALMLDYYEHREDAAFLSGELIPMAHEVLRYYDSRFPRDSNGKLVIRPTQSVETYWYAVVNDTPSVAGLHNVLDRLLALPQEAVPAAEREFWRKMKAATPAIPLKNEEGMVRVLPAERFDPKRTNCENPELYAIWPFACFGLGRPDLPVGIETFRRRIEKASIGWQYDGQCAARLGLTGQAKSILLGKIGNSNRHFRFPAMWGPNYDWLPDQDHGSAIMLTLQYMLLDNSGQKIFLLPAWPKEWDVAFKLWAPGRTVIECVYRHGKIERLEVTPPARQKDVQVPPWLRGETP